MFFGCHLYTKFRRSWKLAAKYRKHSNSIRTICTVGTEHYWHESLGVKGHNLQWSGWHLAQLCHEESSVHTCTRTHKNNGWAKQLLNKWEDPEEPDALIFFFFREKKFQPGLKSVLEKWQVVMCRFFWYSPPPHSMGHIPQFSCFCNGFIGGKVEWRTHHTTSLL